MKKAFMRGVCALNMEAMSMFHSVDQATGISEFVSNSALPFTSKKWTLTVVLVCGR